MKQRIPVVFLALLCAFSWTVPAQAAPDISHAPLDLELPDIGSSAGGLLSAQEEKRIGEEFMRQVRQSVSIVNDPELNDYIQSVGYKLSANSNNQSLNFNFFIVDNPAINAFAGPGGYVGVNTGLILATRNEGELASVLAHEIAHVTQQHLTRTVEQGGKLGLLSIAALIAAIAIGSQNADLGQAALAATQAGSIQSQINSIRTNEEEADRVGIQTLARADFDPRSMPAFFERLQQSSRFAGVGVPEFLRTHPVTESRIADSRSRAEQFPYRQIPDSLSYALAHAKLRVLADKNPKKSVKRFADDLRQGQYNSEKGERYGYGLALLGNSEYAAARSEFNNLLVNDPDNLSYRLALAQVETANGKTSEALRIYERAQQLYPGNHPLTLLYSEALLQNNQAEKARDLLDAHLRNRNPDPQSYTLLAQAENRAGHKAAAYRASAEAAYLNGQTTVAVSLLQQAVGLNEDNFYLDSQIEQRLSELQAEAKEEAKLAAKR